MRIRRAMPDVAPGRDGQGRETEQGVRRFGRALTLYGAATALAVSAAVVTAPSAAADSSLCNPGCSAAADFKSLGEKLVVHDYETDGYGAIGFIYNGSSRKRDCINTKGYDAPPVTCDYEFAEGSQVSYQVCNLTREGLAFNCSVWHYDRA